MSTYPEEFKRLENKIKQLEAENKRLREACEIHIDCLELNYSAEMEDIKELNRIMDKYNVKSSIELEELKDKKIRQALADKEKKE